MNRRQFLRFAAVPVAAAVALPELARTIILPPRGGWPVDMSRYLTSHTAWYLDTSMGDFDTANMRYVYRERYSVVHVFPVKEPSPAVFELIESLKRDWVEVCGSAGA